METPLCNFCIKSGILCQRCQEKVQKGEVSETDINIAKLLFNLENKYPILQKISFYNTYEVDGVLAIIVGRNDLHKLLSSSRGLLRDITEKAHKKIRILEKQGIIRQFFEDLFAPAAITAINKIWLPDGSTETRVIVSGYYRRLPLKLKVIKELAKKARGITLRIGFEHQSGKEF